MYENNIEMSIEPYMNVNTSKSGIRAVIKLSIAVRPIPMLESNNVGSHTETTARCD